MFKIVAVLGLDRPLLWRDMYLLNIFFYLSMYVPNRAQPNFITQNTISKSKWKCKKLIWYFLQKSDTQPQMINKLERSLQFVTQCCNPCYGVPAQIANPKRCSKELPILSLCPLCNIPLWQGQPAISHKSKWSQSIWNGIIAIAIIHRYVKTWKIILNATKIHQMVVVVLLHRKIHWKLFLRYILEIYRKLHFKKLFTVIFFKDLNIWITIIFLFCSVFF